MVELVKAANSEHLRQFDDYARLASTCPVRKQIQLLRQIETNETARHPRDSSRSRPIDPKLLQTQQQSYERNDWRATKQFNPQYDREPLSRKPQKHKSGRKLKKSYLQPPNRLLEQ